MQWRNLCRRSWSHNSLSTGYAGDERKQIPLFSSTGAALGFPSSGTGAGRAHFQLNGGIK